MKKICMVLFVMVLLGCDFNSAVDGDDSDEEMPVVDQVLEKIYTNYPELPRFDERKTIPVPEELESWDAEEDKNEIETVINNANDTAANPYCSLDSFVARSRRTSRATDFTEDCYSTGPDYSSCTYTWKENDGRLEVIWMDTHMVQEESGNTVFTWLVQIYYRDIDENGTPSSPRLVVRDQSTTTHYPTTLIGTEWFTESYIVDEPSGNTYAWSIYRHEYDPIEKMYIAESTVQEWDSFLGYPHMRIRVRCETPDTDELFDYPPTHWQSFCWDINKNCEFLWIDMYIDADDHTWSYTVYNEDGVVVAQDSYP